MGDGKRPDRRRFADSQRDERAHRQRAQRADDRDRIAARQLRARARDQPRRPGLPHRRDSSPTTKWRVRPGTHGEVG